MFSASEPGVVTMRKSLDENETKVNSLKSGVIDPVELPPCVLVGCPGNASDISLGVKKSSLFPLTSPKKLGRVGRHNFFFLVNFFFFFQRKLLIFIFQTCSFLLFLL